MRKVVLYVLGMLLVLMADTAAARESKLRLLRFWNEADHTRIVFDLSARTERTIFLLDHPRRVVIDLANTRLGARIRQPESAQPAFGRIRYARRNEHDLRIVLDLKKKVRPDSFYLKPDRKHGHQLVLDLYDSGPPKVAEKTSPEKHTEPPATKSPKPIGVAGAEPEKTIVKGRSDHQIPEVPAIPGQTVSEPGIELVEKQPEPKKSRVSKPLNEFVVAIDAGHGGNDPGAKGIRGTWEKDVVLDIAKKLDRLIAREPGMRAVLVRDGDYFLALRKRMRLARDAGADIFVSIHADAFHQADIRGSSVYTLSQKGASSEAARWLAAKENESDLIGGLSLDDKDDMLAGVLLDLSQTATMDASSDLAEKVLDNLRELGKTHKRSVQSAGFAVLKSPDIPSILVETAFISNPAEEENLRRSAYQDKLARAILAGIRDYYRLRAVPAMHMASRKHVIEPGETLSGIALKYGISTRKIQAANTLLGTEIKVGQILEIPAGS
ncbi:MAG: N-acetylmuramoyl-L-alanine amidase [Methylococcaceae bacterium]|nr:N-acetylmuramoyl-L-alanine amidase [Methylococcaceae bacterium]MCI0733642.1 N-acetylmuramoyl-L-alanine amidase [Methylococcaceae bacterium]